MPPIPAISITASAGAGRNRPGAGGMDCGMSGPRPIVRTADHPLLSARTPGRHGGRDAGGRRPIMSDWLDQDDLRPLADADPSLQSLITILHGEADSPLTVSLQLPHSENCLFCSINNHRL